MANSGAYPVDVSTPIGMLRALVGDINGSNPVDGVATYEYFDDLELTAIIAQSGGSLNRQQGLAYMAIYRDMSASAVNVTTDDLRADTTFRATQFYKLGTYYLGQADDEDAAAGGNDIFMLSGGNDGRYPYVELLEKEIF